MKNNLQKRAQSAHSAAQEKEVLDDPSLKGESLRQVSEDIAREFPPAVDQTAVVLMDVSPFRLHAFWNLADGVMEKAQRAFGTRVGQVLLVLRFREIAEADGATPATTVPRDAFDREVEAGSGQLVVDVWSPGKTYEAELGLTAEDGGWLSLARSNRVHMPPAGPAERPPPVARPRSGQPAAATSAEAGRVVPPVVPTSPQPTPVAELPEGEPDLPVDRTLVGGDEPLEPVFPNVAPTPQPEPARDAAQVVALALPETPPPPVEPAGDMALVSSPEEPVALSGSLLHLSSSALAQGDAELELFAELHLHGRTQPGKELRLFGRRVPLNADGTFYIRQTIPRESLLLPLLMTETKGTPEGD